MLFLTPDKQCQSTEGSSSWKKWEINGAGREMGEKYESGKKNGRGIRGNGRRGEGTANENGERKRKQLEAAEVEEKGR